MNIIARDHDSDALDSAIPLPKRFERPLKAMVRARMYKWLKDMKMFVSEMAESQNALDSINRVGLGRTVIQVVYK